MFSSIHRAGVYLSLLVIVCGCAAPQATAPSRSTRGTADVATRSTGPKRFVAAIRGFPKSLSPTVDAAGAGSTAGVREVAQLLNSGLSVNGSDGGLIPRLAEN